LDESLGIYIAIRELPEGPIYTPPNNKGKYFPWTAFSWWRRQALLPWEEKVRKERFHLGPCGKGMGRCEDIEMLFLATDAGYAFKYDPSIEAWHRIPACRLTMEYQRDLLYWAERSFQRLKHRRDNKAWRQAFKYVVKKFLREPGIFLGQLATLGLPVGLKLPLENSSDPAIREHLRAAMRRGGEDEILYKFFNPWWY
jgi:hypothetical protein